MPSKTLRPRPSRTASRSGELFVLLLEYSKARHWATWSKSSKPKFFGAVRSGRVWGKRVQRVELPNQDSVPVLMPISPEQLRKARLISAQTIEVVFADGLRRKLSIDDLGIDIEQFKWDTVKASPDGDAILIKSKAGKDIPMDSGSIRCLVDPEYANKIIEAINAVKLSRDELRAFYEETEPPAGW